MRRPGLLVALWIIGGALAVWSASLAVSRVGNQVTGDRPAPLSAADVRRELGIEIATSATAIDGTTTTTDTVATTADPAPTPTAPDGGATTPGGPSPTGTAVTAPPPTAAPGETRTYALVGGTATLRFTPEGVTVVVANPNAGFSVEVEPEGTGVEVTFESEAHHSKVKGWWDGGPRDEVREEAED